MVSQVSKGDFSRSGLGLSRYNLFLSTERVYFCEGENLTSTSPGSPEPLDKAFWSGIIKHRLGSVNFAIIPCGSKSNVLQRLRLAIEAAENTGQKSSTFGCVDRDYDDLEEDTNFCKLAE